MSQHANFSESFYKDHPMFHLAGDVAEICQPLFKNFGMNYFDYARFYKDNSFICLFSDAEWVENFFKRSYSIACTIKNSGMHLWQSYYGDDFLTDVRLFNHDHGATIFLKHENYIEYFDFAAPRENFNVLSHYLNYYETIKNFCEYFIEVSKPLIQKLEKQAIIIPSAMKSSIIEDPDHKDISEINSLVKKRFIDENNLTHRQVECLYHYVKGLRIKEIAKSMQLSPRTVEHYLEAVKVKLDCYTRADLIEISHKNKIILFSEHVKYV